MQGNAEVSELETQWRIVSEKKIKRGQMKIWGMSFIELKREDQMRTEKIDTFPQKTACTFFEVIIAFFHSI